MFRDRLLIIVMMGLMLISVVACTNTSLQDQAVTPAPTVKPESSGAIAKAKGLEQNYLLREEARQFGIYFLRSEETAYKQLRDRLFNNDALASALKATKDEDIIISLAYKFRVGIVAVDINVNASDDEIIGFLKDSLPEAKANKTAFEQSRREASEFGLRLMLWEYDEYKQIRERLFANEKLAAALKAASREGISILLEREFSVRAKYIDINVDATDEEIIEFLLGK